MAAPTVDVTFKGVTIEGQFVERPRSIAPSQWLAFWRDVARLGGEYDYQNPEQGRTLAQAKEAVSLTKG